MHWLPLVAMVIASALPFPRSPAPRPITAAAEPGRNFSNDRANNSNKYNSQSNSSFESKTDTKNSKQNHATVSFLDNSNTSNESLKNSKQLYNVSKKAFSVTTASNQTDKKSQLEYNSPTSIKKLDYDYEDKKKHEEYLFLNNKSRNNFQSDYTQRDNTYQGKDNAITEKKLMTSHPKNQKSDGDQSQSNDISPDSPKTEDYKSQDITTHEGNHLPGSTQKDNYHSPEVMSEEHYEMTYVSNQEHHNPQERIASINKVTQDAVTPVGPYYRLDKQSGKEGAGSLGGGQSGAEGPVEADVSRVKLLGEADLLFLDTHPRVLFSPSSSPPTHPPLLLMLEAGQLIEDDIERGEKEGESVEESNAGFSDAETGAHSEQASPPKARPKRSHTTRTVPRETSVCDARSQWVMDKETAIDDKGQTVTVMKEIQTQKGALKQYFYETRCLAADYRGSGRTRTEGAAGSSEPLGVSGGSCRGVDKKQWVSQCKQKQSFVRALTKVNNLVGWRWIRIDSSCVCVLLSRVSRAETEGGMWRERATKTGRWG